MKSPAPFTCIRLAAGLAALASTPTSAESGEALASGMARPMSALESIVARQNGTRPVASPAMSGTSAPFGPASIDGDRIAALTLAPPVAAYARSMPTARDHRPIGDAPNVFGSTSLRVGKTPLDARWHRVSAGSARQLSGEAMRFIATIRHLSTSAQVAAVNGWVNTRVTFTADLDGDDRWASARETLRRRRGDCEDFAIAKMQLLRALGVPSTSLYFVVAHDLVRRQGHAVLVVRSADSLLMLDSGSDRVQDATLRSDYRPILSFSAGRAWIHGYSTLPGTFASTQTSVAVPGVAS